MAWRTPAPREGDRDRPPSLDRAARCANCWIEIRASPVLKDGRTYCCAMCALGGPCVC